MRQPSFKLWLRYCKPVTGRLVVELGGGHRGGVSTEEDVREICLALPGVTERLSWGRPAWFAGTLMARMWDDDDTSLDQLAEGDEGDDDDENASDGASEEFTQMFDQEGER